MTISARIEQFGRRGACRSGVTRGLVFGKFMPLHRGHQRLIERALADVDELTIAVYDSEPPGEYPAMPVELRASWLRRLYPAAAVAVLDEPERNVESVDPRYAATYADGVRHLGRFDVVFSSEPRYERFARLLDAEHVVVDANRRAAPISGTAIRSDIQRYRDWLDPRVYDSITSLSLES